MAIIMSFTEIFTPKKARRRRQKTVIRNGGSKTAPYGFPCKFAFEAGLRSVRRQTNSLFAFLLIFFLEKSDPFSLKSIEAG